MMRHFGYSYPINFQPFLYIYKADINYPDKILNLKLKPRFSQIELSLNKKLRRTKSSLEFEQSKLVAVNFEKFGTNFSPIHIYQNIRRIYQVNY